MLLGVVNALCILGILGATAWWMVRLYRESPPTTYWEDYAEDLRKERKWFHCQESEEGCQWPDHCTRGDCRKV